MGVEPTLSAWEAGVLPMNYIREWDDYSTDGKKNQSLFRRFFSSGFAAPSGRDDIFADRRAAGGGRPYDGDGDSASKQTLCERREKDSSTRPVGKARNVARFPRVGMLAQNDRINLDPAADSPEAGQSGTK